MARESRGHKEKYGLFKGLQLNVNLHYITYVLLYFPNLDSWKYTRTPTLRISFINR